MRLGATQFIPGFLEQLERVSAGDEKAITVTFPENYPAAAAGRQGPRPSTVTVKEVAAPEAAAVDDELAKRLGLESLDSSPRHDPAADPEPVRLCRRGRRSSVSSSTSSTRCTGSICRRRWSSRSSRTSGVRSPTTWPRRGSSFEKEKISEEEARADYRKIAERRVRLGLVLSEIGERNKIQVTEEEVQRALAAQLRQFPGQEDALLDYYRTNPDALASLRAPIFEEKVVDFLLELVKVTDKPVSREELMREEEDETLA